MVDIIDQGLSEKSSESDRKRTKAFNILSVLLLCFSLLTIVYTVLVIRWGIDHPRSPWLPKYVPYFIHGALINFCVIQLLGVAPTLYLRLKKKYAASCYFMIAFIVLGILLENHIDLNMTAFSTFH